MTKGRPPYTNIRRGVLPEDDKEACQTREYCLAKNARHRAARLGPSLTQKRRSFRMTTDKESWRHDRDRSVEAEETSDSTQTFAGRFAKWIVMLLSIIGLDSGE